MNGDSVSVMEDINNSAENIPFISVIVPVFNSSAVLNRCLDSLLAQTMKDIEIICIDDGSTDNSLEILKEFSLKDSRFRIVEQDNLGAGRARNNGLNHISGKYVHFLDSDDWLSIDAYKILYDKVVAADVDVCIFQKYFYENDTGKISSCIQAFDEGDRIINLDNNPRFLLSNKHIAPWCKICKRSLIVDNNILFDEIICANDRSFHFKLILNSKKIMVCRDPLIYHRVNNNKSLTGLTRSKYYDVHFFAFDSTVRSYEKQDIELIRLVVSACIGDMLHFYKKAHLFYKPWIYSQLHNFFQTLDMTIFNNDKSEYYWYNTYEYIRNHKIGFIRSYLKRNVRKLIERMNEDQ